MRTERRRRLAQGGGLFLCRPRSCENVSECCFEATWREGVRAAGCSAAEARGRRERSRVRLQSEPQQAVGTQQVHRQDRSDP